MPKLSDCVQVLETRIKRGDYVLRDLPTETELANEIGTSRTTARRALIHLMEQGLLARKPHGRLGINTDHDTSQRLRIAFLAPAWGSYWTDRWRVALEQAAAEKHASVRPVDYVHWDDPVITHTLSGFDGVFVVPGSETMPAAVLNRFRRAKNVIMLEAHLSEHGIPSVNMLPPIFIDRLGDHLLSLGHKRIDCFNTQPRDSVITKRIARWQFWQQVNRVEGEIIDEPVEPYTDHMGRAYEVMKRLLEAKKFNATAVVCMTHFVAIGCMRALHEHGLRVGKDVSVCAVEGAGMNRYMVPATTVLETPAPLPYMRVCLEWLAKKSGRWEGPALIEPSDVPLFIGESTGPCKSR